MLIEAKKKRLLLAITLRGLFCCIVTLQLLASGCATPIGVNYVNPRVAYQSLTGNILSAERPSSFSARELMNLNLYQRFENDPAKALAEMHAGLAPKGDEDRLFALVELSFAHAERTEDKSYYLAAAVYAYSFILPGEHGTAPRAIDPRFRWAADIYNQALTRAAMIDQKPVPRAGNFSLPFGEITIDFNENDLIWAGYRLTNFVPAADIAIRGLRNRYRIPGIGAALAASVEPLSDTTAKEYARIPTRLRVPVTAFLRLDDPRGALGSGKLKGKLEFYTPDSARTVSVAGIDVPIEYETTSALALTLEGAPIWDFEIAGFRSGDFKVGEGNLRQGLFMLHPHRRGRMPLVLVHGTASSPARWAELVNELENDRRFWENYEIWLFMYNTGNPIAYSALLLRDALTELVSELDPTGSDAGLKNMVVMGHSQGGLLTKMSVIDSGMALWPFSVPPEELDVSAETRDMFTRALIFKPLPFVKEVIFVATPHGGSFQALGILGNFASWLVNLPGRFTKLSLDLVTLQKQGFILGPFSGMPTSITNMNPGNRFIKALGGIPIANGVVAHSIIAVEGDGPPEQGDDGVVKYSSAHIDGVASEKIVRSSHSTQGHPETIQEVKRILFERKQE
ncbi:MAG TPA: alpha/beta hydrolase [Candidatus Polarisedimenticolaceae bacterium]|nr:alpha/beta hydrolase [Candidatus Polarisedimenticolaceae bacterium]